MSESQRLLVLRHSAVRQRRFGRGKGRNVFFKRFSRMARRNATILSILLVLVCGSGALKDAAAQCSPIPRQPESFAYMTDVFEIPKIPFLSDGTARRTKASCDDLDARFQGEDGRGLVTDAVAEFARYLGIACGRADKRKEEVTQVGGALGIRTEETRCVGREMKSPGQFCKDYISLMQVFEKNIVEVVFDDELPCDCETTIKLRYLDEAGRPFSPEESVSEPIFE